MLQRRAQSETNINVSLLILHAFQVEGNVSYTAGEYLVNFALVVKLLCESNRTTVMINN